MPEIASLHTAVILGVCATFVVPIWNGSECKHNHAYTHLAYKHTHNPDVTQTPRLLGVFVTLHITSVTS